MILRYKPIKKVGYVIAYMIRHDNITAKAARRRLDRMSRGTMFELLYSLARLEADGFLRAKNKQV